MCETAYLIRAQITDAYIEVELSDGRRLATPLAWYPALMNVSQAERDQLEIWPWGLHWPLLDEDLSLDGMLLGQPGLQSRPIIPSEKRRADVNVTGPFDADKIGLQNGLVDFPSLEKRIDG